MIQLISPAGANRPRTMTKIQGGRLKGQEGFEIAWEGHRDKRPPRFVSLFVNARMCVKGNT